MVVTTFRPRPRNSSLKVTKLQAPADMRFSANMFARAFAKDWQKKTANNDC